MKVLRAMGRGNASVERCALGGRGPLGLRSWDVVIAKVVPYHWVLRLRVDGRQLRVDGTRLSTVSALRPCRPAPETSCQSLRGKS